VGEKREEGKRREGTGGEEKTYRKICFLPIGGGGSLLTSLVAMMAQLCLGSSWYVFESMFRKVVKVDRARGLSDSASLEVHRSTSDPSNVIGKLENLDVKRGILCAGR
jgi:hypothetical protein